MKTHINSIFINTTRMKRVLFFAVAAIALAACSKTYEVKPVAQQEIGFGTWANTLTKTHDPGNTTDFAEGDDFNVYATKTVNSVSSDVFIGTVVTKGTSAWDYAPHRYWDSNASSYTFYAVAPAGLLDGTGASATTEGVFTSEPIEFLGGDTQKSDIKDILVAAKKEVTPTGTPATFASPVNISFYHIASLVDLKVQKKDDLEVASENANNYIKVAVTAISLTNIDGNGHFNISSYNTSTPFNPVTNNSTWTEETNAAKKTYTHESGYVTATLPTDVHTVTEANPDALITKLVVMPQTFRTAETDHTSDQTVNITYTIETCEDGNSSTSSPFTASFDLKEFDTAQDYTNTEANYITGWLPGYHYTYIITIGANAITFTADIQNWTGSNGYHYLIN